MATDIYKLVPLTTLKSYLKIDQDDTSEDDTIQIIRDSVENLIEQETGQFFGPSGDYIETRDGTGYHDIWTFRPITTVNVITIKMGLAETPSWLLPMNIVTDLRYRPGHRRISSIFYEFPIGKDNIVIDYTAAANAPPLAVHAVLEACAIGYQQRGSEEVRSEQLGTYAHSMKRDITEGMFWKKAVDNLTISPIG